MTLSSSSEEKAFQSISDPVEDSEEFFEEDWVYAKENPEELTETTKKVLMIRNLDKIEDKIDKKVERQWSPFKL